MVAFFSKVQLTGCKLYPIVWNVIKSPELSDSAVDAVTTDGASHNQYFFRFCWPHDANSIGDQCLVGHNPQERKIPSSSVLAAG